MIYWKGTTTDKVKRYTAEGQTFKEVYERIQEKYGYDNVIDENALELKMLEENGYETSEFMDENGFDFEAFDTLDLPNELHNYDYRDIIEESQSEAYYHEFIFDED